jgi:subtilisin-like proprotein convertase family protein
MKNLIKTFGAVVVVLGMAVAAQATLYTFSGFSGAAIPDANIAGNSFTINNLENMTWSSGGGSGTGFGTDLSIQDVNVTLNISGGYNGDLYGYLVHSSGFCVLLNRVGTGFESGPYAGEPYYTYGFSTEGFGNIKLDDQSDNGSIHGIENPAGGTYTSDGGTLSSFTGSPNGTWTLFLADLSGGETSTLVSWGLEIEAVPEPVTWALIIFGGLTGTLSVGRWARRRLARAGGCEPQ